MSEEREDSGGEEAVPFERDLPGVEITPPAQQHTDPGPHQPVDGLDRGVAREHLDHESQGVRPEEVDRAAETPPEP